MHFIRADVSSIHCVSKVNTEIMRGEFVLTLVHVFGRVYQSRQLNKCVSLPQHTVRMWMCSKSITVQSIWWDKLITHKHQHSTENTLNSGYI